MAYVTIKRIKPRAEWYEDEPIVCGRDVLVEDAEPEPTGLLDSNGTPIYRVAEKIKVGFVP